MATPDKYRTIASDRPRTSASIRDMQIASQGWWEEVNEVRRNPTSARSERPASRAGTSYSGRSRGEMSTAISPETSRESNYSERPPTGRATTAMARRERNGSDPPAHSRNGPRHTPVESHGNDTRQYTPTSRSVSRTQTAHQYSASRDAQSRMATPSLHADKEVGKHQAMLLEVSPLPTMSRGVVS